MLMHIRLASELQTDSIVDGEGVRTVIWMQGCAHNCFNCHNPSTHSFDGGFLKEIGELKKEMDLLEGQDGITLSGGDPFFQIDGALEIAQYAKSIGFSVWSYTGFRFEQLLKRSKKEEQLFRLLQNIDVIIDGKFEDELKSYDCIFRGSSNQRIIDVAKSLKEDKPVLLNKYYKSKEKPKKDKLIYV